MGKPSSKTNTKGCIGCNAPAEDVVLVQERCAGEVESDMWCCAHCDRVWLENPEEEGERMVAEL